MAFGVRRPGRGARGGVPWRVVLLLVLLLATAAGLWAWTQSRAREEAERQLGLDASRVLSVHFSAAAAVKVGALSGEVVTRAQSDSLGGLVTAEQTVKAPYSVDYLVDLAKVGPEAYRWDPDTRTMTVELPDVTPAKPNIDEARAQVSQRGVWISRGAGREMARETSERAALRAAETAQRPENLNRARENARRVVERLSSAPLEAAGLDGVRVAVRFPWEGAPGASDGERLDASRPIEDVLKERERSQTKSS